VPLSDALRVNHYDLIGISVQFSIQDALYKEAALMASHSGALVVAGGFHAAAVPAPLGVYHVIRGSGEVGLVPETTFADVDYPPVTADMLEPYWSIGRPHDLQSKTPHWMPVEFSRGCARRCEYCGGPRFWGATEYYSKEAISKHLDQLVAIGVEELFVEDDNWIADPKRFKWILGELKARHLAWSTPNGIFAQRLKPFVHELADSGCWRVSLPFETGTASTARLMRLGNKWMTYYEALGLTMSLQAEGIKTCGFFIIGYPGETLRDMQRTLDYAKGLPLDQRVVSIATPYPGTALFERCLKQNYLAVPPDELYEKLLFTHGLIGTADFTPQDVEHLKFSDRREALKRRETLAT